MIYRIAGITTELMPLYETLSKQALPYISDLKTAEISAVLHSAEIKQYQNENPHLSPDECEYIWTGSLFYNQVIAYDCFFLHSSALCYNNKAYLFSGPSGVGKSTHTSLWQQAFGDDVTIINDDKPIIKLVDNVFYACGTPWSGKTDKNTNIQVPINGLFFLHQSKENIIRKATTEKALYSILNQTLRPNEPNMLDKLLTIVGQFIKTVPVYEFGCNISLDAVQAALRACNNHETQSVT